MDESCVMSEALSLFTPLAFTAVGVRSNTTFLISTSLQSINESPTSQSPTLALSKTTFPQFLACSPKLMINPPSERRSYHLATNVFLTDHHSIIQVVADPALHDRPGCRTHLRHTFPLHLTARQSSAQPAGTKPETAGRQLPVRRRTSTRTPGSRIAIAPTPHNGNWLLSSWSAILLRVRDAPRQFSRPNSTIFILAEPQLSLRMGAMLPLLR